MLIRGIFAPAGVKVFALLVKMSQNSSENEPKFWIIRFAFGTDPS
jgi:hypothetical protein